VLFVSRNLLSLGVRPPLTFNGVKVNEISFTVESHSYQNPWKRKAFRNKYCFRAPCNCPLFKQRRNTLSVTRGNRIIEKCTYIYFTYRTMPMVVRTFDGLDRRFSAGKLEMLSIVNRLVRDLQIYLWNTDELNECDWSSRYTRRTYLFTFADRLFSVYFRELYYIYDGKRLLIVLFNQTTAIFESCAIVTGDAWQILRIKLWQFARRIVYEFGSTWLTAVVVQRTRDVVVERPSTGWSD